ncbi:N-6 DNA methylase [Providencia rettgeri]|nr:N-6 DNA methylase [Providencia rettgeri]
MNQLITHNNELKRSIDSLKINESFEKVDLDEIDRILRDFFPINQIREIGAFFTGQSLARQTVLSFNTPIKMNSIILDPTCGAGNLLIECSRSLSVKKTLTETLKTWGNILRGYDLYEPFVETAKLRIIIEALSRGVSLDCSVIEALTFLHHIKVKDAMSVTAEELKSVTHAVMNPPFIEWLSPKQNYWKQGKVNSAGIIFDHYIRLLPVNCNICAILPDVLRSGSRYLPFREFVSSELTAICHIWGRFNNQTDVDVFILSGVKTFNNYKKIEWVTDLGIYTKLEKYFNVQVGPLVAYRDPETGPSYPYFHPKNSPVWSTIIDTSEKRRFSGKVLKPPLILIKRTSSPSDKYRASATIINLKEQIAVENHMIAVIPKSGNLSDCKKLLKILKAESTNDFLNNRARMRHLTVGAIKDIPICW